MQAATGGGDFFVGSWKKENTLESPLKCWNLERILDNQMRMAAPSAEITLEEFVTETEDATGENEVEIVN